jgi:Bifunctional DNA primase/polymerase, N-terminal
MADLAAANLCLANLTAALELAHAGIPIFPARITRRFNSWEKAPLVKGWQEVATTDEIQVRVWWKQFPGAVPGVELGRAELVVIDPDRHGKGADGIEAFAQLVADIGDLPAHPTTDTPSGHHHIFRQNGGQPLGNSPGGLPPGVDVRGSGGWIVGPGSVRSDGVVYQPHVGTPSLPQAYRTGAIPALPVALDAIVRQPDPERVRERNARPDRHGFVFHDGPVDVDAAFAAMVYESKEGKGINATVCRVIPSLLRKPNIPTTCSFAWSMKSWEWPNASVCSGAGRRKPSSPSSVF